MPEFQALITFGDGLQALFYDESAEYDNIEGQRVKDILVVPSVELAERYKITDEHLHVKCDDGRSAMWRTYNVADIKWLNRSKLGAHILILCAFNGVDTELMHYADGYAHYCRVLQMENSRLRGALLKEQRLKEDITNNMIEAARRQKELTEMNAPPKSNEFIDESNLPNPQ